MASSIKNPLWLKKGKRLKQIIKEQKISVQEMSDIICISHHTVSHINSGSKNLTDENAKMVIQHFPQYRIEWLTGQDDYKTMGDFYKSNISKQRGILKEFLDESQLLNESVIGLASLNGYDYQCCLDGLKTAESVIKALPKAHKLTDRKTGQEIYFSVESFNRLQNHISNVTGLILKNEFESQKK